MNETIVEQKKPYLPLHIIHRSIPFFFFSSFNPEQYSATRVKGRT